MSDIIERFRYRFDLWRRERREDLFGVPRNYDEPPEIVVDSAEAAKGRWQRKAPDEIERVDRRLRFNPLYSLGFALFAATIMTIAASWGFWGHFVQPAPPMPLSRAFRAFPFFFVFMFITLYVPQIVRRIPKIPDRAAMICDQCHEVTDYSTDPHCHCGGHRELLAHWRWISDAPKRPLGATRAV